MAGVFTVKGDSDIGLSMRENQRTRALTEANSQYSVVDTEERSTEPSSTGFPSSTVRLTRVIDLIPTRARTNLTWMIGGNKGVPH